MRFLDDAHEFNFDGKVDYLGRNAYEFSFVSTGLEDITKVVAIYPPFKEKKDWYNLSFGNLDGQDIRYKNTRNNKQDFKKVLRTVFNCVIYFLVRIEPNAKVVFFGNAKHKHRIYKFLLGGQIEVLKQDLAVRGGRLLIDGEIPTKKSKERTVSNDGTEFERDIDEKDIQDILENVKEIDFLEDYNVNNSENYHFILISAKINDREDIN